MRTTTLLLAAALSMFIGLLFAALVLSDADRACQTVQHETGRSCQTQP